MPIRDPNETRVVLSIAQPDGLPLIADGHILEDHESSSSITEYPVESGSNAVDHVQQLPYRIAIRAYTSDVFPTEGVLQGVPAVERGAKAWETILGAQRTGQLVTVFTKLRIYRNMAIVQARARSDIETGNSAVFDIALRELQMAEVQGLLTQFDADSIVNDRSYGSGNSRDYAHPTSPREFESYWAGYVENAMIISRLNDGTPQGLLDSLNTKSAQRASNPYLPATLRVAEGAAAIIGTGAAAIPQSIQALADSDAISDFRRSGVGEFLFGRVR